MVATVKPSFTTRVQPVSRAHRLHQRGLRVGHQNKDISIQAEVVDPAVQFCGDIDSWAAGENTHTGETRKQMVNLLIWITGRTCPPEPDHP